MTALPHPSDVCGASARQQGGVEAHEELLDILREASAGSTFFGVVEGPDGRSEVHRFTANTVEPTHQDTLPVTATPTLLLTSDEARDTGSLDLPTHESVAEPPSPPRILFSRIWYDKPIGKTFTRQADGTLHKETLADGVSGWAYIIEASTIESIEEVVRSTTAQEILVAGVAWYDKLKVTTKTALRFSHEVARSKEHFPFPLGPGLMVLDDDVEGGGFDAYVRAIPELAQASYVTTPSSSAWIHDASTGAALKGAGGLHTLVPVAEATDIPRALNAMHQRLVLNGQGVAAITRVGAILIKSPVDTAMKSPNQPVFQRVSVGPGLIQRKDEHIRAVRGGVFLFDTRLIRDLDDEERRRLGEIENKLRAGVSQKAKATREAWIGIHAPSIAQKTGKPIETVTKILSQALAGESARYDLYPGMVIPFAGGKVDVAEVLANPEQYDGQLCADPFEPEYGSGVGVAKFYANLRSGKPVINSHAHGGQKFFLHEVLPDISGILSQPIGPIRNALDGGHITTLPASHSNPLLGTWSPPPRLDERVVPLAGVLDDADYEHPHVISKLVPTGQITLLGGHGGGGKSFLMLLFAILVATGRSLGGVEIPRRERACFFSAEDDMKLLRARVGRICRVLDIDPSVLEGWLFLLDMSDVDPTLFAPEESKRPAFNKLTDELVAFTFAHEIQLTVIDNASDTFGGNEIARDEVRHFLRGLRQKLAHRGRAVILLAHVNKFAAANNGRSSYATDEDYSGSTAWHNSVRSRLSLEPAKGGGTVLVHRKANYGPKADSITIDWLDGVPVPAGASEAPGAVMVAEMLKAQQEQRDASDKAAIVALIEDVEQRGEDFPAADRGPCTAYSTAKRSPLLPAGMTASRLNSLLGSLEKEGKIVRWTIDTPRRGTKDIFTCSADAAERARIRATVKVASPGKGGDRAA